MSELWPSLTPLAAVSDPVNPFLLACNIQRIKWDEPEDFLPIVPSDHDNRFSATSSFYHGANLLVEVRKSAVRCTIRHKRRRVIEPCPYKEVTEYTVYSVTSSNFKKCCRAYDQNFLMELEHRRNEVVSRPVTVPCMRLTFARIL